MSDVSWNTRVLGERGTQVSGQPVDDLGAPPFLGTPLADQGADPPVKGQPVRCSPGGRLARGGLHQLQQVGVPDGHKPGLGYHGLCHRVILSGQPRPQHRARMRNRLLRNYRHRQCSGQTSSGAVLHPAATSHRRAGYATEPGVLSSASAPVTMGPSPHRVHSTSTTRPRG